MAILFSSFTATIYTNTTMTASSNIAKKTADKGLLNIVIHFSNIAKKTADKGLLNIVIHHGSIGGCIPNMELWTICDD
jgi:hypothetical protein